MKKFSKILIVILATMLLVGTLALAISASSEVSVQKVDGKFVVAGVGYDTWESAVVAANNTFTIYLNEDITLSESLVTSGSDVKVKLNLNGKTVTVGNGVATAFNAQKGSSFTVTGSGVINNVANCFGAAGGSVFTVEATGKDGITINHASVASGSTVISAFRIHDRASLNLSGLITVNAVNGTRNVIHMGAGSGTKGASALNISNAKILVPLLTNGYYAGVGSGANEYSKLIILSDDIDVDIVDSEFDVQYGMLIYATGSGGTADVSAYKDGTHSWKEGAATGISIADPTIRFTAKNSKFSSDYSNYSKKFAANGLNPGASFIGVYAKMSAHFDNCIIYADFRAVTSDSNGTITTKKLNQHQLLFTDCHIFDAPGDNTTAPFFVYGVNYKIIGGSFSGSAGVANGSHYYLPLKDAEGNETGEWAGGYIDNALLNVARTFVTTGITGNWVDATYTEPNSLKTHEITLLIDGEERKFRSGHFSDEDAYEVYFPKEEVAPDTPDNPDGPVIVDNVSPYIYGASDGNTVLETGDYYKENAAAAVGKHPLATPTKGVAAFGSNTNLGYVSSVLSQNGNGYAKYYYDGVNTIGSTGSSNYAYIQTPTGASGSIVTTDMFVIEWDVSTDDGAFAATTLATQGRMKHAVYNSSGQLLGYMNSAGTKNSLTYDPKASISISNNDKLYFDDSAYTLPTNGDWTRITLVIDFEVSELKEIDYPVYADNGTKFVPVEGETVKIQGYEVLKYDYILYVNGEYFDTISLDPKAGGLEGYIAKGCEGNYYIDGIRISFRGVKDQVQSTCFDNVRVSKYTNADKVDVGLYDDEGAPVESIQGLEHFLIMVDNSTIVPPPPPAVIVDGNRYENDADAIAAIKNGSVIELERSMTTTIDVDAILENLGLEVMSFTIKSGGFRIPTVTASTHKLAAVPGANGEYAVTPIGVIVDGVNYDTDAEAIAAIRNGSVIKLDRDMKLPINVDSILEGLGGESISFKILPGDFKLPAIISSNHKVLDYTGAFGGYLVTKADVGEIYTIRFADDVFGFSHTVSYVAEGTVYPEYITTAEGEEVAYDGYLWFITDWQDGNNGATANGYFADKNLQINMIAKYEKFAYYYEISVNGKTKYVTESAFGGNLAEALELGDVSVILWRDVTLDSSTELDGKLDIDLNGCDILVDGAQGINVFELLGGAKLTIYSTREGASVAVLGNSTLFSVEYDRYKAGDVSISIENIAINASKLVNYYDSYVHDPSLGEDIYKYTRKLTLDINNLSLTGGASGEAVINTSLPTVIRANALDYVGDATLLLASPKECATLIASFDNSSFNSPAELLNVPGTNKSVSFTNSYIAAPVSVSKTTVGEEVVLGEETISLGIGCSFEATQAEIVDAGLQLEDGCVFANADADGVKCYVDLPENLAMIIWLDASGNPIGEANYNAPFGKPVMIFTDEEAAEKVGKLVDNDWYSKSFAGWDIPADFELSVGSFCIYPTFTDPEVSVKCLKMDLVAYTYFELNLYLPAANLPEGVVPQGIYSECKCADSHDHSRDSNYKLINGKWYVLLESGMASIGGEMYSSYTVYPGASDASEPEYKIVFTIEGKEYVETVKCGVPTYAENVMNEIMKDGVSLDELSEEDKILASLVMNMVRYANESYKLANADENGFPTFGNRKYEGLLNDYSELLVSYDSISFTESETDINISEIGEYMEGVSFIFGTYQPRFVFKYRSDVLDKLVKPETSDGRIYTWPEGNRGVFSQIYHERYDGTKSISYIAPHIAYNGNDYVMPDIVSGAWGPITDAYATTVDMSVRDATGVINVAVFGPDGTVVRGSYSLAAYIESLSATVEEARAIALEARHAANEAAMRAERAAEEAAKPENAAIKDRYEKMQAEYESEKVLQEGIAAKNEAICNENEAFMNASLSLYAFSLVSQDYAKTLVK